MNDDVQPPDTPSDELVAVNAVLDGTASAAEQTLVDASPELTALLESYRVTRRELALVDVPSEAREAGIAAALAAFDQLDVATGAAPRAASNVVVLQRRRTWYRAVTGAAAALVLVVAGVAALSSLGNSSSNSESAATVPASQKSQEAGSTDAPAADDASSPMAATAVADTMSPAATDAGATQIETSSGAADASTPAPAENPPVSTIGSIGGAADPRTPVADQTALATYVASATARPAGAQQCAPSGGESLGEISYQGTPAIVIRDPATGDVTVFDAANCSVLTTLQP